MHCDPRRCRGEEAQKPHHGRSGFHPSGRLDRLASAGRTSEAFARAKSAHPRGLRWCRNRCHSAGQASWCDRRTTTSTANLEWVKRLGADLVIDYRKDDFEHILQDYDVVLNSLGAETLAKSLRVLKPGGKLISISGPPDPEFAKDRGLSWIVRLAMRLLSSRIRNKAKRHHVSYSFLFMRASGEQLREIGSLIDAGIIRPVVDRVFPFAETKEALAYVETGRAKGKVVVKVR